MKDRQYKDSMAFFTIGLIGAIVVLAGCLIGVLFTELFTDI